MLKSSKQTIPTISESFQSFYLETILITTNHLDSELTEVSVSEGAPGQPWGHLTQVHPAHLHILVGRIRPARLSHSINRRRPNHFHLDRTTETVRERFAHVPGVILSRKYCPAVQV